MSYIAGNYDIIIVGAGHAGCEAALASAKMGCNTLMLTLSLDSVAFMPCNPNIGGTSKGHLVREIDALGGQMGIAADATYIQVRMLNMSKGPAVHSLRAQSDKLAYQNFMRKQLENQPNLTLAQAEVKEILTDDNKVIGIETVSGAVYNAQSIVICSGVYMNSRIITGEYTRNSGPSGFLRSEYLSEALVSAGVTMQRFKTGTPARVDGNTIDYTKMQVQNGDEALHHFSFVTQDFTRDQANCYLTYTNLDTHKIILDNIHRSPMYSGEIKGTGARYCPSIEDKVVRFSDKDRHQIFIEPEGYYTNEMYVQGMSTSLPEDVQTAMLRTIEGMENVHITRFGYAIEYDCIDPTQLSPTLAIKHIKGLFTAGQINGSSGYEEAAAQGLIAGINAARFIKGEAGIIISRNQGYIGVLIDDLVTLGTNEPYRMMTSRAEFRLSLRQDNADMRLTAIGHEAGLVTEARMQAFLDKKSAMQTAIEQLSTLKPSMDTLKAICEYSNENLPTQGLNYAELLKRQNITYNMLTQFDDRLITLSQDAAFTVQTDIKYEGYLKKQQAQINEMQRMENKLLPENIDYSTINGLRLESRQKLNRLRPASIGQASRISGVNPADIAVLLVYLEKHNER